MAKLLLAFASLFAGVIPATAQTYTFTPWAGSPPGGYADGTGRAARFNDPRDVALDPSGNLFVADTGNRVIRKITPAGEVSTFAGAQGQAGSEDGPGAVAHFTRPSGLAVDQAGNVFVADNDTIRKITPAGVVTTVAGRAGEPGSTDGRGSSARFAFSKSFSSDGGLATDGDGNLYVADSGNATVRKMTSDGVVTTVGGIAGLRGLTDGTRETGRLSEPVRLSVDNAGNIFVADWGIGNVRKVSPNGDITSLIRTTQNSFGQSWYWYMSAYGVTTDATGNVYVVISDDGVGDSGGGVIRVSPAGVMSPFAGGGGIGSEDGTGTRARFFDPKGFTRDRSGTIFVADTGNHAIRKITADGVVTTVAGDSPASVDGRGKAARFRNPGQLAIDASGNVFVSDRGAIRKITPDGLVTTLPIAVPFVDQSHFFQAAVLLAVDGLGNVYVGERFQYGEARKLRKLTSSGIVTTLITFGPDTFLSGVAADRAGNVVITSYNNARPAGYSTVSKVTPEGRTTFLAGGPKQESMPRASADGVGAAAQFNELTGIAVNRRGELFVAESTTIRKIAPDGAVTTIAGIAGQQGRQDGIGNAARFSSVLSLAVDNSDQLLVLDNGALRMITDGIVTTLPVSSSEGVGPTWSTLSLTVDGSGAIYTCDSYACTLSKGIPLSTPSGSRLLNASVRANLRDQQPLIVGFDLRGGARPMLLRAIGPGLQPFVAGTALAGDPRLTLFGRSGTVVATNDNWGGAPELTVAFAAVGAFPLDENSADSALLPSLAGQSTVQVTSPMGGTTLFELFDVGPPAATSGIANFSARHVIRGAEDSFSLGFSVEGGAKTVLIRTIGPTLRDAPFNISTALTFPILTVFDGGGQVIARGGETGASGPLEAIFTRVGAFPLRGNGGWDAALLLTLPSGAYSAVLTGAAGTVGDALLELYDVP